MVEGVDGFTEYHANNGGGGGGNWIGNLDGG